MGYVCDILACYFVVITLCSFALLVAGCAIYAGYSRRLPVFREDALKTFSTPIDAGISVIISAYGRLSEVEDMMKVEYPESEFIIMCNIGRDDEALDVIHRYSLIKTEYVSTQEVYESGVNGVYRSTDKRHRNVVLVDMAFIGETPMLNAGVNIARYEWVMPLLEGEHLDRDALNIFAAELASREGACHGHSCAGLAALSDPAETPRSMFGRLRMRRDMCRFAIGAGMITGRQMCGSRVYVFSREKVIETGGFGDADDPGRDMATRIARMKRGHGEAKNRIDLVPYNIARTYTEGGVHYECWFMRLMRRTTIAAGLLLVIILILGVANGRMEILFTVLWLAVYLLMWYIAEIGVVTLCGKYFRKR